MVNSYYGIYQAERGKTATEIRVADAELGGWAAELGQLGSVLAAPARADVLNIGIVGDPHGAGPIGDDAHDLKPRRLDDVLQLERDQYLVFNDEELLRHRPFS